MSILVDRNTRVLVSGITGHVGSYQMLKMLECGTRVVAGVSPGHGGQRVHGVPVFDSVAEAASMEPDVSIIFVPAPHAGDAIMESVDAGVPLVVCITEGVPVRDVMRVRRFMQGGDSRLIGPNCPGVITPNECKVGIMPCEIHAPGRIGVVSRSGTLTYEIVDILTRSGFGQSTCVGIGGDMLVGTGFVEVLSMFEEDEGTDAVVLIGEVGGSEEEEAARFIRGMSKPVVVFVAGISAPPGRRMGHAGAVVSGSSGTAGEKIEMLKKNGASVASMPSEIPVHLRSVL